LVVVALWRLALWGGVNLPGRVGDLLIIGYAQFFVCGIVFFDAWSAERWKPIHTVLMLAAITMQISIVGTWKAIPMVLFCAVFAMAITGRLTFLRKPFVVWLGVISYPLYLLHQMVGYRVIRLGDELDLSRFLIVPVAILVSVAAAALVNKTVEKPALRAIRGWYDRTAKRRPDLVVVETAKI
jgi:peptidoglycan/LPS O-acetylase OafA/YrhL